MNQARWDPILALANYKPETNSCPSRIGETISIIFILVYFSNDIIHFPIILYGYFLTTCVATFLLEGDNMFEGILILPRGQYGSLKHFFMLFR